jgi:hypothetical protein
MVGSDRRISYIDDFDLSYRYDIALVLEKKTIEWITISSNGNCNCLDHLFSMDKITLLFTNQKIECYDSFKTRHTYVAVVNIE